jgi:hypothetical protein
MIGIAVLLVGIGVLWVCFAYGVYLFTRTGREGIRIARITNSRAFISKSFGCFLYHPIYGVDIAAACKK